MQSLFLLLGGDYLKKILCFSLSIILCFSSVSAVYASSDSDHGGTGGSIGDGSTGSSDGDHGGTGGTVGWDELERPDHSELNKILSALGFMMFPENKVGSAGQTLLGLIGLDDLDDDTKNYINDNVEENTRTDGNYYYFNQNFIKNVNEKVQSRVHALDGYYLYNSLGANTFDNFNKYYALYHDGKTLSYSSDSEYQNIMRIVNKDFTFVSSDGYFYYFSDKCYDGTYYFYLSEQGWLYCYDTSTGNTIYNRFAYRTDFWRYYNLGSQALTTDYVKNFIGTLGAPVKVFYSIQDIRNYLNQGKKYYSPNLPTNKTIKVPVNLASIKPTLNLDFDITGKLENEIQASLDLVFQNYLDKLAELNTPAKPTPTPGSSSGGSGSSGGDHGGIGGDFDTPTPTPNPDSGFTSGTYDLLEQIYNWLVNFGEKHDIFAKKITDYIEANDGKLDQIIEAINALADGKTETDVNGCKYDFTALSDFMKDLWNNSDQKFETMIDLLEENNKYQQKLVNSLNEIKAILVTQTVLELFQDRSSETANKAKDKFPTSIPWDVPLLNIKSSSFPCSPYVWTELPHTDANLGILNSIP